MNNLMRAPATTSARLARLRVTRTAESGPRPPPTVRAELRATRLAQALGGRLLEAGGGRLVAVESEVELDLDRRRLAQLPFTAGEDRPLVCLDLETTGLGTGTGTLPFLIGLGIWHGTRLRVIQLVLPDHADEGELLAGLAHLIPPAALLVTYNGRSFDWPLLVTRFRLHRRDPPPVAGHLDLLPVARQLWRHRLDDARLATVERHIGGVERDNDLPGALVPERYFSYLRRQEPQLLNEVIEHNRQDIVSLGRLMQVLSELATVGGRADAHPGDLAGLARAYARRGRQMEALACLEAALGSASWAHGIVGGAPLYRRLATERALTLARLGRRAEALIAWHELASRGGPGAATAWLRIAVHREHVEADFELALDACRQAAQVCGRSRAWGRPLAGVERDLRRRMARLERRRRRAWLRHPPASYARGAIA